MHTASTRLIISSFERLVVCGGDSGVGLSFGVEVPGGVDGASVVARRSEHANCY